MRQIYSTESREAIKRGIDAAANAIKSTLGAKGKTVLISPLNRPLRTTKDGVSVAREIELDNELEATGARIVREASEKTLEIAGDGTTTSALLVQELTNEALIRINGGAESLLLKSGMDRATKEVLANLESQRKDIKGKEEIKYVASIAANDEEIGEILGNIFSEIGKDGTVDIQESPTFEHQVETVLGMQLGKGYVSPLFITNLEKRECLLKDPCVILLEGKPIFQEILPILDILIKKEKRQVIFLAEDFDDAFLGQLLMNKAAGIFLPLAVKLPGVGMEKREYLQDIATLTGAKLPSESGRKEYKEEDIGTCKKVLSNKDKTAIIGGGGDKKQVEARVKWLEYEVKNTSSEYERNELKARIGRLKGGVAVFKVGGVTEREIKEKKDRVEDAVFATKAALEEGIVAGGGIALLNARKAIKLGNYEGDERKGAEMLRNSLQAPFMCILRNAGKNGGEIIKKLEKNGGYDVKKGKLVKDMFKAGIIDPLKVVKTCLVNAVSTVGTFITSEYYIVEEKEIYENKRFNS